MILMPLIERVEIQKAYQTFFDSMRKGSILLTRTLSWRGGDTEVVVFWHDKLAFWSHFDSEDDSYWCVFGVQNAAELPRFHINCEINMPKNGINRRFAGLFVRDNNGNIYITHNGNLRGGRKGISGTAFRGSFQRDEFIEIAWQDGYESETILIGRLDDPKLPIYISHFVKRVYLFKEQVVSGKNHKLIDLIGKKYSPEFSGQRRNYKHDDIIKSQCNHGLVIDALHDLLETYGWKTANDNQRDLFIYDDAGNIIMLFEAKTDLSTSSIYSGIGQLMYHTAVHDKTPKPVLVVPGEPTPDTAKILNRLGIEILTYKLDEAKVLFSEGSTLFKEIIR
jgi:hypothetical protein